MYSPESIKCEQTQCLKLFIIELFNINIYIYLLYKGNFLNIGISTMIFSCIYFQNEFMVVQ